MAYGRFGWIRERHAKADHPPAVRAVSPRLSIQHLPLTIVEYELKDKQRRFSAWPLNADVRGIHT